MDIFTTQISKWRVARNQQIAFVDTTVKSGIKLFAPTWDIVMGHKAGTLSDEAYTAEYRRLMSQSWRAKTPEWQAFLRMGEPVAIACYCPAGAFCHRHLLKDIFEDLCQRQGLPFFYYGELS